MSISSVLKQFKSDAQVLGLSENLFLIQVIFNTQNGDPAAKAKLEEIRDAAVDQDDIDFFQALLDGSIRVDSSSRLHSPVADSFQLVPHDPTPRGLAFFSEAGAGWRRQGALLRKKQGQNPDKGTQSCHLRKRSRNRRGER